ncbi:MAG TPA: 6-carboxytetrahydropterin synthase [Anaerolineales bacterium]|nr:6-carboxytetrahydropterin synthase [Anaerolineales bacterium]
MYRLCLQRSFEAFHYLIGGDWGPENETHPHPYRVEWILEGPSLDKHGYLVDLIDLEARLDEACQRYRGVVLNDLPEFQALNPSLEHFARLVNERLTRDLNPAGLAGSEVRLWESATAWASFHLTL